MESFDIVTLTVNPALDKSSHFKGLVPEQKIRCETPRFDAGGGGINVSKAIARLEGVSKAIFTSGGATGEKLKELIESEKIPFETIAIHSWTRESFVAVDDNDIDAINKKAVSRLQANGDMSFIMLIKDFTFEMESMLTVGDSIGS